MEQYIKKSAVVAEIEKTEKYSKHKAKEAVDVYWQIHFDGWVTACRSIMSFLDTLEVKEVDLDKEFDSFLNDIEGMPPMWHSEEQIEWGKDIARHFFELGLKAQKVKEVDLIIHTIIAECCDWLAMNTNLSHDKIEECRNLMLAGMEKMKEEMMKNVVLETKVMKDSDGDGIDTPYEEWLTLEDTEIPFIPDDIGLKDGDKVKVIIIKQ